MTYLLTKEKLLKLMPKFPKVNIDQWIKDLNTAMTDGHINVNRDRVCMFLAQTGHESYQFRFMREEWESSPQQLRYERDFNAPWPAPNKTDKNHLAFILGNDTKGDGFIFRGWGPLQCTGKTNTSKASMFIFGNNKLVTSPSLLDNFLNGLKGAVWYWTQNNLNVPSDLKDLLTVTKKINGGINGIELRQKLYDLAQQVL